MQPRINNFLENIKTTLLNERQQWFLWMPVFYAMGILVYFSLSSTPQIYYAITGAFIAAIAALFFRKNTGIFYIFLIIFFIISGFAGANIRALLVNAPVLERSLRISSVQGRIVEIDTYKKGHRVIFDNVKIENLPAERTPEKIRLTVLTKIGNAMAGDVVEVRASLAPPPKAVAPGAYDFARNAYFQRIGAVGFSVSNFVIISKSNNSFNETIQQIRNTIAIRFENSIGGVQGEIAKSLFMGDTGGIDDSTMVAIRNSGLAHLLSISGLHLVIVCAIFFTLTRTILACFPAISLNYNIKKIAALLAILGSYFYLLLSGNQIPAFRSFVMSSMALVAVMVDRSGSPLRLCAIAAFCILVVAPENILSPSFQMSFGAVIALISAFQWLNPRLFAFALAYKVPKILMAVFSTVISSIVATLATAPFAIYHFNRNSPYGVVANMLAIPMTTFEIMPFGVLALFLMPFHLEWLVAIPLKFGIDFIIWVSNYVSSLPYANSTIMGINDWQLLSISFGFLWLTLWQTKWRLLGILFIIVACAFAPFNKMPDVIINSEATLFAVRDENGDLIFSSTTSGRYARGVWSARAGQEDSVRIGKSSSKLISCDSLGCIYKKNGYEVAIIKHPVALEVDCRQSVIFINLTGIKYNCESAAVQINSYDLKEHGTHEIYLGDGVTVKAVL